MTKKILYIDMDNVLVNFQSGIASWSGSESWSRRTKNGKRRLIGIVRNNL